MKIADYAKRVAIRRVVYIVIAAIIAVATQFIGQAKAQTPTDPTCHSLTSGTYCTKAQAQQHCDTVDRNAWSANMNLSRCVDMPRIVERPSDPEGSISCQRRSSEGSTNWSTCMTGGHNYYKAPTCAAPEVYDPTTGACGTNCAAKPPLQNVLATRTSTSGAACIQGCFYAPGASSAGGLFQFNLQARSGLQFVHEAATTWNPTGASCAQPDENKPYDPSKDTCVQQGTLTQCVKPDGKFCVTATTGRRICWAPGETGQKTTQDGSLAGDRQKAPAAPSVTGIEGGESNTGQHAVNNTTYNQDIKTGGTQSGSGQSNTGDGGADDTDGDGKNEDQGSASGGGTCGAPPTCSGDPINCAILQQQWQTRCQSDKNDDGQPDWTEGDAPETPGGEGNGYEEGDVKRFGIPMGPSQLDDTDIFGGGSCPNFSITIIGFEASTADIPAWCDIAAIMRGIILIMGAYTALQILQGRFVL